MLEKYSSESFIFLTEKNKTVYSIFVICYSNMMSYMLSHTNKDDVILLSNLILEKFLLCYIPQVFLPKHK